LQGCNKKIFPDSKSWGTLKASTGGAKYLAHNLIPLADLFLYRGLCSGRERKPGSKSRLSGSKTMPTCIFPNLLSLLPPDEACPLAGTDLSSEGLVDSSSCY
jgi:hypothetical protein